MDQNTIHLVVAADAFTPVNTLLDADRVRRFAVGAAEGVHIIVDKAERRRINDRGDVDAIAFERLEERFQVGPAGDTLKHDTVLLGERQGRGAVLDMLFEFLSQQFERLSSLDLAAGGYDVGHVVEQVKTGHRCGLILEIVADLQPGFCGAVGVGADLFELLFIPLVAGNLLKLDDRVVELAAYVLHIAVIDFHMVVVGDVDHNQRAVVHAGDILIPFGHAVADVVAAEDEVRAGYAAAFVGGDGAVRTGQADPRISADVRVKAHLLGDLAHPLAIVLGSDTGCLVLRIDNGKAKRLGDLGRELGGGPANRTALFFCSPRSGVNVGNDLAQCFCCGAGFFLRLRGRSRSRGFLGFSHDDSYLRI